MCISSHGKDGKMKTARSFGLAISLTLLCVGPTLAAGGSPTDVIEAVGTNRGICVILGDDGCGRALELAEKTKFITVLLTV